MRRFDIDELLRRRVDEVLYYIWDPHGVSDVPSARGEYDRYVPGVLQVVAENNNIEPISSHLAEVMRTAMSLSPEKKQCDHTAEMLLSHKKAIEEGCA